MPPQHPAAAATAALAAGCEASTALIGMAGGRQLGDTVTRLPRPSKTGESSRTVPLAALRVQLLLALHQGP